MKILFINSVNGIRSTGRIVTDLADKYIAQGHDVKIAYGRETVPERFREISYRIGTELDVRINVLKVRLFDNEGMNAVRQTRKFINWAEKYNPDMLWLHNIHGYYLNIELLFDWIKSRPQMEIKWTLHDCWAFTGHCVHFSYINCNKWKEYCCECPQKKTYPISLFRDNSMENYIYKQRNFCGVKNMTIVTPSYWLSDLVKQSFLKEYSTEVHHNTIDVDKFKPTYSDFRDRYNLKDKKIVLGVQSSWSQRKGLADFFALSNKLDNSFVIVLVGLTKGQIEKDNIIYIARTDSTEQLAKIYTAADVFVNMTYEDNYPTVNLEAQACGTPCLTYRTGGSIESVPPENVIEQGNIDQMASRIQEICR